jgi:hypothetical protein
MLDLSCRASKGSQLFYHIEIHGVAVGLLHDLGDLLV